MMSDRFASQDLNIATGINLVLPVYSFLTLKVPVAIDLHVMKAKHLLYKVSGSRMA